MISWTEYYLGIVRAVKQKSKDRSIQVGALIYNPVTHAVLSPGYNGFPRGVKDTVESRHVRPDKYLFTEHAERNAIYQAARHGITTEGMGICLEWFPCADCARAIVQSGISEIIACQPDFKDERWGKSFEAAWDILLEGRVKYIQIPNEYEVAA